MTPCDIAIDKDFVEIVGHPCDRVLCAMVTALVCAIARYIPDDVEFTLDDGFFRLPRARIANDPNYAPALFMFEAALRDISDSYPGNFTFQSTVSYPQP